MTSAAPVPGTRRPRQVTVGAMLAVFGSSVALAMLVSTMAELDSPAMRDVLQQVVDDPRGATLELTTEGAREVMKYLIMVMGVVCGTSLILALFVLRRDRSARVALTVLGGLVLMLTLLAGPVGWVLAFYISVSVGLLWTRPARAWFADRSSPGPGAPGSGDAAYPGWHHLPEGGDFPPPPSGSPPPPPPPPPPPQG